MGKQPPLGRDVLFLGPVPMSEESIAGHKPGHPNAESLLTLSSSASTHCFLEYTFYRSVTVLEGTKKHLATLDSEKLRVQWERV